MGIIKPDPAFWRHILEKENVRPTDAFFIDDLAENIRAAEKLGLAAHLFTGAEGLAQALFSPPA
jgi:HAD superfamily hydrolase (TIGR01509 family)